MRAAAVWIGLACLALLGACSEGAEPPDDPARADKAERDSPTAQEFAPLAPPAGFVEVTGEGFSLARPPEFTAERRTSSNGQPMLVLNSPSGDGTLVGVVRDVQPRSDAMAQSFVLEEQKRLMEKATGVSREEIEWPGAEVALLVQWTDQRQSAPGEPFRTVQLIAQVDKELILSVVATAPASSFEQSQVATVLRTFRPKRPAS